MANRLFSLNTVKMLTLVKGNQTLNDNPHRFFSQGWRRKNTYVEQLLGRLKEKKQTVWPDSQLGPLGSKDQRLSLPGNIGLDKEVLPPEEPSPERLKADKAEIEELAKFWKNLLTTPTSHQHQLNIVEQVEENERRDAEEMEALGKKLLGINESLECIAKPCPDLLRIELISLFKNVIVTEGPLTIITFYQRTSNDAEDDSESPSEEEMEALTEKFIASARDLCETLRKKAVWADFIEPNSGRPFYGSFTNLSLFESNKKYQHGGFSVEELGECKVIEHQQWNNSTFVGTLFTTAPHDCEHLISLIEKVNQDNR